MIETYIRALSEKDLHQQIYEYFFVFWMNFFKNNVCGSNLITSDSVERRATQKMKDSSSPRASYFFFFFYCALQYMGF